MKPKLKRTAAELAEAQMHSALPQMPGMPPVVRMEFKGAHLGPTAARSADVVVADTASSTPPSLSSRSHSWIFWGRGRDSLLSLCAHA